jgi:hypothetical protein
MNLPLISHEIPHSLAKAEANGDYDINDYQFILLHRYIEDSTYRSIVDSYDGFTILDNSCYELGSALSNNLIADYVERIKPDVFVLPDVLGNMADTINRSTRFLEEYPDLESKAMAVIQGNSKEEFKECYEWFDENCPNLAMIGIPFCFNWGFEQKLDPIAHAMERVNLIDYLLAEGVIRNTTKHHLLGTWWAAEFGYYKEHDWVYSIDTSNPIAAAIDGDRYPIEWKPKIKFDEFVGMDLTGPQMSDIIHNVRWFREVAKRD